MADLAKLVVRDGEGATKFVTVRVKSESGPRLSRAAATSIATSSLVKTALYGKDANWGRILCAIGYAPGIMGSTRNLPEDKVKRAKSLGVFRQMPSHTTVSFVPADGSPELKLLVRGEPQTVDEERAKEILEMEDLEISVNLADRDLFREDEKIEYSEAVVWTCDFSHEYVTINGKILKHLPCPRHSLTSLLPLQGTIAPRVAYCKVVAAEVNTLGPGVTRFIQTHRRSGDKIWRKGSKEGGRTCPCSRISTACSVLATSMYASAFPGNVIQATQEPGCGRERWRRRGSVGVEPPGLALGLASEAAAWIAGVGGNALQTLSRFAVWDDLDMPS